MIVKNGCKYFGGHLKFLDSFDLVFSFLPEVTPWKSLICKSFSIGAQRQFQILIFLPWNTCYEYNALIASTSRSSNKKTSKLCCIFIYLPHSFIFWLWLCSHLLINMLNHICRANHGIRDVMCNDKCHNPRWPLLLTYLK